MKVSSRLHRIHRSRRAAAAILGAAVVATSLFVPPPASAAPPACEYKDVLTARRALTDWPVSVLDTIYMLHSSYAPTDLVDTSQAGLNGGYKVRSHVIKDLSAMASAARAAGTPIGVVSGYRSYQQQAETFNYWVSVGGYDQALKTSARAGHSEHQLGTTLDFNTPGGPAPWDMADWAATPAGAWMKANAWKYGFVMTYPAGKTGVTCYSYEPWHYRYVGRNISRVIQESGLTLREWQWASGYGAPVQNPDTTPPAVIARSPGPSSLVGTSTAVRAWFSEPVSGVGAHSFSLWNSSSGAVIPITVTYDALGRSARLQPNAPLQPGFTYKVGLSGRIVDASGNPLSWTTWTFATSGMTTTASWNPAQRVVFAAATHTGYKFNTAGTVLASKTSSTSGTSYAYATYRAMINGRPYLWITTGTFAGYWVPESANARPG